MKKLVIDQSKLNSDVIKTLLEICPFGGFEESNGKLEFSAGCRSCGLCAKRGPKGVVYEVEETVVGIDKSKWVGIAVYVEHNEERVHPVVFELIGKAKELAKVINQPVYAVLISNSYLVDKYQDEILSYGVDRLYVYKDDLFAPFNVELHKIAMENFIKLFRPGSILYGGTSIGRSFAPRVAACFRTGLTADCTILDMKENTDLIQIRPAFGGNVMAQIICPNHRPQMATVRPKIFKMPERITEIDPKKVINLKTPKDLTTNITILEIAKKPKVEDISAAEVIVAIGRPFKTKEQVELAEELANLLGGIVAVTRPLVEAGLKDARYQIGLSGRTVSPKLIISFGISGAVQYTAGMTNSELIISVNTDKEAPIFGVSHYGIVGDVFEVMTRMIEQLKKGKGLI